MPIPIQLSGGNLEVAIDGKSRPNGSSVAGEVALALQMDLAKPVQNHDRAAALEADHRRSAIREQQFQACRPFASHP